MLRGMILAISMGLMVFTLAGTAAVAEGGDKGMTVVAVGGGSLENALFQNGQEGDATFSFSAGYDKNGALKGSFFAKRVFLAETTRTNISTEITYLEVEEQGQCAWMRMEGIAKFKARWAHKPVPDNTFAIEALDCDGQGDGTDMIWFQMWNPFGGQKTAVSLDDFTEVDGGNIMILPFALE